MKIGVLISRIGGEDGVALETEKWIEVLHHMGHEVSLLSGEHERNILDSEHQKVLPEFSLLSKENLWEQEKAFLNPDKNQNKIIDYIEKRSNIISDKIIKWIYDKNLNALISENASSLPINLSMAIGIKKAVEKTGIKIITHDHDFYWERKNRYVSSHEQINKIVKETIPLNLPNVINIVINTSAQKVLQEKYNISEVIVIPNVMDFSKKLENHNYNGDFLKRFGFKKDDIILLQPTRVIRRKGIGTAIKLIYKLNDKKIKLFITGGDRASNYYERLLALIKKLGLESQIVFSKRRIVGSLLIEAYNCANSCTYFSTYEGFGNAFVESVLLKKPVFVNNYKPVFWEDIGKKGFKVVMIENNGLTDESIEKIKKIIYDDKLNKEIGEYNFNLGKKYFSYELLKEKLNNILNENFKSAIIPYVFYEKEKRF